MNQNSPNVARVRRTQRNRKSLNSSPLLWALIAAFLVTALVTAYLTYAVVREFVLQTGDEPALAAVPAPGEEDGEPQVRTDFDQFSPLQNSSGPTAEPWDGNERVNVLVMGLDYGDVVEEQGDAARSDSMMLFTIDPESRTAGMLSIPRDLWVNIPNFGYGKINTAHYLGEVYDLEGGGPGLAMSTMEDLLDLDINYYAVVDFQAFEDFIDEIGGIVVDVPEEISVDPIGPGNTVILEAGTQTLDGPTALAYARNRDTIGSDFDRAQRQQQVVLAIRRRILDLDMLPELIQKSPVLYQQLSSGVRTNLSLKDVIGLAWLASQIDGANIKRAAIGPDQVTQTYSPEGMDILQPDIEALFLLRDLIFTTTGPAQPSTVVEAEPVATVSDQILVAEEAPPAITPQDLRTLFQEENARVELLNGTGTIGLAAETSTFLLEQGVNVVNAGNADEEASLTTIIDYTGKPYTTQFLVELLQIQPSRIYSRYDPNSQVDIAIILGEDWAENNTLP
jgi:polyisoprenyl-teichoic acid--peptidoglycan teichoic acid transferase